MLTWIALTAALGAGQAPLPEGSSDTAAALEAINTLCPLYLKREGLTPSEIETVRAAVEFRSGQPPRLRGRPETAEMQVLGGPAMCALRRPEDGTGRIAIDSIQLAAGLTQSGWTVGDPRGHMWRASKDAMTIDVLPAADFLISVSVPDPKSSLALPEANPFETVLLKVLLSSCGGLLPGVTETTESERLSVQLARLPEACSISIQGPAAEAVVGELHRALQGQDSGWSLHARAFMVGEPGPGSVEKNYRHRDGREFWISERQASGGFAGQLWRGPIQPD